MSAFTSLRNILLFTPHKNWICSHLSTSIALIQKSSQTSLPPQEGQTVPAWTWSTGSVPKGLGRPSSLTADISKEVEPNITLAVDLVVKISQERCSATPVS